MKVLGTGFEMVWGAKENKPIAQFENGVFVTKDEKLFARLIELGYKTDEEGEKVLAGLKKDKSNSAKQPPETTKLDETDKENQDKTDSEKTESDLPYPVRMPDETSQQFASRVKAWKKAQKENAEEQGEE